MKLIPSFPRRIPRWVASSSSRSASTAQQQDLGYCSSSEGEDATSSSFTNRNELERAPLKQLIKALRRHKQIPGEQILALLIRRCATERAAEEGRQIHDLIAKNAQARRSRFLFNNLIQMFGACGEIEQAVALFERGRVPKNIYTWMMMITACIDNDRPLAALRFFQRMQLEGCRPDAHIVSCILSAIAMAGDLASGKLIHSSIQNTPDLADHIVVANSVLNMYSKCGSMEDLEQAFARMPIRDDISWTTLMSSLIRAGKDSCAIRCLKFMDLEGVKIETHPTFTSLVDACGNLAAISQGKCLHARILASGVRMGAALQSALINMYAKCGRIEESFQIFTRIENPNTIAWSSMIAAFARNGHFAAALKLFWAMEQQGHKPDKITLTHVLYACNHGGFIDQAFHYFTSINRDRNLELDTELYGCVVDLLARAGWLAEAEELLHKMPIPPDSVCWMALLQACKLQQNAQIAARAAEQVIKLAPKRAGPYDVLSHIYPESGHSMKSVMPIARRKLEQDRSSM